MFFITDKSKLLFWKIFASVSNEGTFLKSTKQKQNYSNLVLFIIVKQSSCRKIHPIILLEK